MRRSKVVRGAAVLSTALVLAGCVTNQAAPPGSTARDVTTLAIGVDLPFGGLAIDASINTMRAMELYLEQVDHRAGPYRVELIKYDNAPDPHSTWDDTECIRNASNHVANRHEVAVIGTFLTGCSKIEMPILNAAPDGPMLMISHTVNDPGLTKNWEPGEPAKYFPSGMRSFGRVVTTDDRQGPAAAHFAAADLGVKRCFVLNDGDTYGKGVAKAFAAEARRLGIQIVGEARWRQRDADNYRALFAPAKTAAADCVYLGGIYDSGGDKLIRDKVAVLGDNTAVKLIAPDGFTGYPDFVMRPEAAGAYLTATDLPGELLTAPGGAAEQFLADYRTRWGSDPGSDGVLFGVRDQRGNAVLYGVQALQMILAAVEKSDGTRRGVRNQVFDGAGITIAADRAILGKTISIDPATGDTNINDVTVLLVKDREETLVKGVST